MKEELKGIALVLLCAVANSANAGCVGPVINGRCTAGVYAPGYGENPGYGEEARQGYQGSSGQRYEYDLNNPVDRNRYSIDLDAQRRDQMNQYNTDRSRDRMQGQRGGGIRWDE